MGLPLAGAWGWQQEMRLEVGLAHHPVHHAEDLGFYSEGYVRPGEDWKPGVTWSILDGRTLSTVARVKDPRGKWRGEELEHSAAPGNSQSPGSGGGPGERRRFEKSFGLRG